MQLQLLKERVPTATILLMPEPDRQFLMEADASDVVAGGVLLQRSTANQKVHPCVFFPHRLTSTSGAAHSEIAAVGVMALAGWG